MIARTAARLRWSLAFAAVTALGAATGAGQVAPLGEPHLTIIPRTEAESARIADVTAPTSDFSQPELYEPHPAGKATFFGAATRDSFSAPSANLPFDRRMDFAVGDSFFRRLWVTAPASTTSSDGLGPLYNARACQRCHIRDGRGHPPENADDSGVSMFLRVSIPKDASDLDAATLAYLEDAPEPTYGLQIQDKSIAGHAAEARMVIDYHPVPVRLGDGSVIELRKPGYRLANLGYGPLHPQARLSPRIAPPMIGLGLLEAVPEADILAQTDPEDADGDGISGRPNIVWSDEFDQWMLGRFGLKAGSPTIRAQSMAAFASDIGLSNPLHPDGAGECTARQTDCRTAPNGNSAKDGDLEVSAQVMDLVTFYGRNLAVPQRRRPDDPQVLRGKELFYASGCTACHRPKFVTHRLTDRDEQSFQLIWPYSDLLLHDMGEGLADHRPEWRANGREWRTAPLWGIGMTDTVSGEDASYLHDGRARTLLEAVLWHGGEAESAREAVRHMPAEDRTALIAFLESL